MNNRKIALLAIPVLAALFAIPTGLANASGCENINGTSGNDKISGGDGIQCIFGFAGNDKIQAGDGSDSITPGDGRDRVAAGDGNDVIILENDGDVDRILCGDGNDTVIYLDSLDPLDILRDCETVIVNI